MVPVFDLNKDLQALLEKPRQRRPITEFAFQPVLQWEDLPSVVIEQNSGDDRIRSTLRMINQFDVMYLFGEGKKGITRKAGPVVYEEGRTGSSVSNTTPSFNIYHEGIRDVFVPIAPDKVLKKNPTKEEDELECRLYKEFKARGLPVPDASLTTEGLVINFAGHENFAEHVSGVRSLSEVDTLMEMSDKMMELISCFDCTSGEILTESDKEKINESTIEKLSQLFEVEPSLAKERYYAFRIMQAIPGGDREVVGLLDGIEGVLNSGLEKYGSWSIDIYPRNLFPVFEKGIFDHHLVIDFNRPKFISRQEADAIAIDAYLPIKEVDGRPRLYRNCPVTSIYDEKTRQPLIGRRFFKFQEISGDKGDIKDYAAYIPPARFFVNLKQAWYALKELSRADTYPKIFDKMAEVGHHLQLSLGNLLATGGQQEDEELYKKLGGYINHKYVEAVEKMIPEEVIDAGEKWCEAYMHS